MKNLSVRIKLVLATVPSLFILIIFTVFFLSKMNSVYEDAEEIYYHRLYTINSNLINADRDFYQAIQASTKQFNMESSNSPSLTDEIRQQNIDDFEENKQQVLDNMNVACEAAKHDADLWSNTKSEDGKTFEQIAGEFETSYNEWVGTYDPSAGPISEEQFIAHSEKFAEARDHLNALQEITEVWADNENKKIA